VREVTRLGAAPQYLYTNGWFEGTIGVNLLSSTYLQQ